LPPVRLGTGHRARLCYSSRMAERTVVYVCRGKHCSERRKQRQRLTAALSDSAKVVECGCMKICKGPVVGVAVDGELAWFRAIDSDKAIARLRKLVRKGKLTPALAKRRVDQRTGQAPKGC
jgi:(2Fe-2S) ferredoxin